MARNVVIICTLIFISQKQGRSLERADVKRLFRRQSPHNCLLNFACVSFSNPSVKGKNEFRVRPSSLCPL